MHRYLSVLSAVIALAPVYASAAPKMNEGEWQYEMQMQMKGAPVNLPPMRFSNCMKPGDLVPKPEQQKSECRKSDEKISGNNVSWTMRCTQQNSEIEMRGNATFNGDTMHGTMDHTMKSGGKVQMTSSGKISGKRIGPCKSQ